MKKRTFCERKKSYTKKDAQTARNWVERERGVKCYIYPCPCGAWHLSHKRI